MLKHKSKILKASKIKESEFLEIYFALTQRITFINEEQIPGDIWKKALMFTTGIDEADTPFMALALYIHGLLWTGDKKLIRGVTARGFKTILTTDDILTGSY
ncbi:MAG: PIN domain-containing protein [Pseudomonadota bacterium]